MPDIDSLDSAERPGGPDQLGAPEVSAFVTDKVARRHPEILDAHRALADPTAPPGRRLELVETAVSALDKTSDPTQQLQWHLLACVLPVAVLVVADPLATTDQADRAAECAVRIISWTQIIAFGSHYQIDPTPERTAAIAPLHEEHHWASPTARLRVLEAAKHPPAPRPTPRRRLP